VSREPIKKVDETALSRGRKGILVGGGILLVAENNSYAR